MIIFYVTILTHYPRNYIYFQRFSYILFVFICLFRSACGKGEIEFGLCLWKYFLQMNFYVKIEMSDESLKSNDKSKHAVFLLRVLYF